MKNALKLIGLAFLIFAFAFNTNSDKRIIVIDVAHGGKDNGSLSNGISEKDISLQVAQKIKDLNQDKKIEIVLTRDIDKFISIEERAKFVNSLKPEMVLSLHVNFAKTESLKGQEVFISKANKAYEISKHLANKLKSAFAENIKIKEANFSILKSVNCPALLLELGFLSNPTDRKFMSSEEGQQYLAASIYEKLIK